MSGIAADSEQFGIIGYNDLEHAAASMPSISSFRTSRYEMDSRTVEMIVATWRGDRPELAVIDVGCELKERPGTER